MVHTPGSIFLLPGELLMRSWPGIVGLVVAAYSIPVGAGGYDSLLKLAEDWRQFEQPAVSHCLPDYGAAAMAAKAAMLPGYRAKLRNLDTRGWSTTQQVDEQLIGAEIDGLDFN